MIKKNHRKTFLTILAVIIQISCVIALIPSLKASTFIPSNFYGELDLDTTYIYNISSYNSSKRLEWRALDWSLKDTANSTINGQIRVNFTGFYDKDPLDIFNNFSSPMVYMNISFYENVNNNLVLNNTFLNVSNGESAMNLLLGYNTFQAGFLIPNDEFNYLKEFAQKQDQPPYMNATVNIEEEGTQISFEFLQISDTPQNTKLTYDKRSGILLTTNTTFGNYTLIMTLTNPPIFSNGNGIPSYNLFLLVSTGLVSVIIIIFIKRKKEIK